MKKSKKNLLLLITLFVSFSVFAETDAEQNLPGQITESPYENSDLEATSPYLENGIKENLVEKEGLSSDGMGVPVGASDEWTEKYDVPKEGNENYLEFKNSELALELFQKADSALTFTYLYDTFTYNSKGDVFEKTFRNENSAKSGQSGYFLLSYQKMFYRGAFDFYWKTNTGLSYNTGRGRFIDDGSLSETSFNLWLLPIDFMLGSKLNLGRYVGVSVAAGGLAVGVIQNRSDRGEEDDDKNIRQVLTGYAAEASLELSLSQMFPSWANYLKTNSEVSDFSLAFTGRMMDASNSKSDEFGISGTSFGLGFKFELL
ncbi:hypothetical protein [Bacteriovorax sp. Seq25_V]|uniref:hypothetical protein n=1 Tax=Bacteriovorax sp. Seq25_V TaxID=1201288 RepID=UPI000389E30E|nr:hypothetical protein [Bacteriovorax sp. Seq25_V]EQC44782.1 hypothetical protein M900_0309 [Bacteriovorax sp. Seq25_V]